jgi:predicted small secreted protein
MRITLLMLALLCLMAGLNGCNTIKGIGQDVARAGNGIANAAR